jgi:hypothetical protein
VALSLDFLMISELLTSQPLHCSTPACHWSFQAGVSFLFRTFPPIISWGSHISLGVPSSPSSLQNLPSMCFRASGLWCFPFH